ncbi:MAG: Mu transposase C-terminal domain-containing protein [Flavipsychrobacter sp.]
MERIDGKIYLTYDELVPGIMPEGTYKGARGRNALEVLGRGGRGNQVLINYHSLSEVYRKLVIATLGDPEKLLATDPIKERIVPDHHAQAFYTNYLLPTGGKLPIDDINKLATAASWLKGIAQMAADKRVLKATLGMSMAEFWQRVATLIADNRIDLPKNRIRLQEKLELFKAQGYVTLIEVHKYGNNNRSKVKDEVSEALLLELIGNDKKHDDSIVLELYNKWAVANGQPIIKSVGTIANYRKRNDWQLRPMREGGRDNYNRYGLVIKRARPSAPLLLVNSDDNDLDLFFIDTDRTDSGKYYHRYKLVVVIDAYNDYILGYATGRTQTQQLVYEAYLNAMYNIKRLTGQWYLPHQLQADRWGLDKNLTNSLAQFYKSLGVFTPAKVGNARSKYIERSFGTEWHQQLKMFPNYGGHNITSKEKRNSDAVELAKRDFPTMEQSPAVIEAFIQRMRQCKDREAKWLEAFMASEKSRERSITDEHMLLIFGTRHETGNQYEGNTITNEGITITIEGAKYTYQVPEELYLQNVGKTVQVVYDAQDMTRILVTDGGTLRFIAYQTGLMPSALADYKEGDRKRLNELLERKQRDMIKQAAAGEMRKNLLESAGVNAESLLQAGVLIKDIKQGAEQLYIEQNAAKPASSKGFNPYEQM